MKGVPAAVITLWMPALCSTGLFLFLNGLEPQYWVICIAVLPVLGFMNTLAEVRRQGKQIRIRRWWGSISVDESDIVDISRSVLQGIGRLRVRRFMPPWGVIYFVADWSNVEVLHDSITVRQVDPPVDLRSRVADLFAAVLIAASGFALGRMLISDFHKFSIARLSSSILALTISALLAVLFIFSRKRHGTLAAVLLFVATLIAALVRT
jgi:hypothetical protein